MNNSRKDPGVAFWATVLLVVALLVYPLSYGRWIGYVGCAPRWIATATRPAYCPLTEAYRRNLVPVYSEYLHWWVRVSLERKDRESEEAFEALKREEAFEALNK